MGCCCPDNKPLGDIVVDEICGNFSIPCGEKNVVLWEADAVLVERGTETGGSISIYVEKSCDKPLEVVIRDFDDNVLKTFEISAGNTRSFTSLNIKSITINCNHDEEKKPNGICRGKYCINYHYDVLVNI